MAFGDVLGTLAGSGISVTNPSNTTTGSVAVSVGDLVVAVMAEQTSLTVTAVTDNLGNTYTAQNVGTDAGTATGRMFFSRVTTAGTLTVVHFTATASTDNYVVAAVAYAGPFATSPLDANPANLSGDITSPFTCPATGVLSQASELVIGWAASGTLTVVTWAGSGITKDVQATDGAVMNAAIGHAVTTSTTSVTPAFTGTAPSSTDVLGTASFKAAPTVALPFGQIVTDVTYPVRGAVGDAFGWNDQSIINFIIPFAQSDWPNPNRPLPQPLTWVDTYPNRGAGTVPSNPRNQTDWPNPVRIPSGIVTDFVDQSIIGLVIPFNQTNWPNPVRSPVAPIEFHDTFNKPVVAVQKPLNQTDWPNPRGVFVPLSTLGSINGPIVLVPSPFSQQNWPNPTRATSPAQGWIDTYNRTTVTAQLPFGNKNYDLPPRTHRPNQGWTDSYPNRAVVVQVPFFSSSTFDVPRGPTATEPGFVDQAIFAFTIPFSQTDWTNPQLPRPQGLSFSNSFLLELLPVPQKPLNQLDWQNPSRGPEWSVRRIGFIDGSLIEIEPFSQLDWPNPVVGRVSPSLGWIDSYPNRTVSVPFFQNYWQNPQVRATLPVYWIDTYNRTPPLIPFHQNDWPNPQRNIVLPFWWTDSYNRTPVAIGNPFSQTDWPNPRGPTSSHPVGIIPYAASLMPIPPPPPPSTQPDWNPFLTTLGRLSCIG